MLELTVIQGEREQVSLGLCDTLEGCGVDLSGGNCKDSVWASGGVTERRPGDGAALSINPEREDTGHQTGHGLGPCAAWHGWANRSDWYGRANTQGEGRKYSRISFMEFAGNKFPSWLAGVEKQDTWDISLDRFSLREMAKSCLSVWGDAGMERVEEWPEWAEFLSCYELTKCPVYLGTKVYKMADFWDQVYMKLQVK